MDNPYIVEETDDYAVVFKPAKMHSVPEKKDLSQRRRGAENAEEKECDTSIYNWYFKFSSNNVNVKLMHRLDFETHGLVLFAKNEKSYHFFKELQDRGEFIKEYSAVCVQRNDYVRLEGFPNNNSAILAPLRLCEKNLVIQSYFRPFGPGRKQVRPVIDDGKKHKEIAKDKGGFYRTEIIEKIDNIFTVRIKRGFRHQIRCHLCWAGFPILNDSLYTYTEAISPESQLALKSYALFFVDPASGERKECRIEPLK